MSRMIMAAVAVAAALGILIGAGVQHDGGASVAGPKYPCLSHNYPKECGPM